MEEYAKNILEWLQRRVADAEARDLKLRPMKDHINEITERIKSASEEEIPILIKLQDEAIQTLIDHVAAKK